MSKRLKFLMTGCCLAITTITMAQSNARSSFSDADALYTNIGCDVTIKKEDNKWIALSEFTEDLLYKSDNSVKFMNRGYIFHSSFNELKKWEAYTQVQDNKKLRVSNTVTNSSKEDYIFYDDIKTTSFDYSGAIVGATRHLEYQLQNNDLHLLTPFYFERYFPVANGQLRITFPSDIKIKYIIKGLNRDKVQFSESHKRDKTTYTFTVSDLEGGRPYPDAPDNAYYSTHLIFYIDQAKEGDKWSGFLSSPSDLYKHYYSYIKDINHHLSPELQNITDSLIGQASSDIEKAQKIYRWVQTNIKYVAFEDGMEGFVPREASLVCTRKFGDCKDMASILTAMLNYAKLPAYLTWIGTRNIPYEYTDVPLPLVDNHMICTINLENNYVFLDGTDAGCVFGMVPATIQGKQAMVAIGENEFKILTVPVTPKNQNTFSDSTVMELSDKGIEGHISILLRGYYASDLLAILNYKNNKERDDYLNNRFGRANNKISFINWKVEELKSDHSQARVTASFELPDYAKKVGNEWFVNLNLYKWYTGAEIDYPKRKIPIEYPFLKHSSYVTIIKVPANYTVTYVPQSDEFKNEVWGYVLKYKQTEDTVSLTQEFDDNFLMLYPGQFQDWNKVLEHLFPNYKQTLSFTKKSL